MSKWCDDPDDIRREQNRRLAKIVQRYQQLMLLRSQTTDLAGQKSLASDIEACLLMLWEELEPGMVQLAWNWLSRAPMWKNSALAPEESLGREGIHTIALNFFIALIEELPRLSIDPDRNVRAFLKRTAQNVHYDAQKASRSVPSWLTDSLDQPGHPASTQPLGDAIPHPDSLGLEEQTVAALDNKALQRIVWDYCRSNLKGVDWILMELRWFTEPPVNFKAIAAQLGPGWSEANVRKRHQRIIERIRAYLHKQGWDSEL